MKTVSVLARMLLEITRTTTRQHLMVVHCFAILTTAPRSAGRARSGRTSPDSHIEHDAGTAHAPQQQEPRAEAFGGLGCNDAVVLRDIAQSNAREQ